ncbi:MAG: hypothetical protein IKH30_03415 [Clostridia bacterium]|nr:hypothetical protein [Clostridia bacterium]
MKIKFRDKAIILVGAAATLVVGAALLVTGLQAKGLSGAGIGGALRTLRIIFGLICAGFSVYLLTLPRLYGMQRRDYVVQRTESGELRIAVKAIENLVEKCIDLHEEIHLISMSIVNTREGVVVELNISLANNISIPLAVASLQKQIKQYLVASSGIEVREVRVIVENTKDEPLLVAEIEEEEENEPEKAPMHQRLFCQAEQQTVVPAQPKPEEQKDAMPDENRAVALNDIPAAVPQAEERKDEQ